MLSACHQSDAKLKYVSYWDRRSNIFMHIARFCQLKMVCRWTSNNKPWKSYMKTCVKGKKIKLVCTGKNCGIGHTLSSAVCENITDFGRCWQKNVCPQRHFFIVQDSEGGPLNQSPASSDSPSSLPGWPLTQFFSGSFL